jgi:hypothetical protein
MNTSKILDVVPQATPGPAQTPAPQPRTPPQAVQAVGDGAASDALRQHAERSAEAEAAEAARKRSAPKAEPRPHSFDREVGYVDDSFQVFVDLVSPTLQSHRFRIFGPPDKPEDLPPPLETSDPASAHAAYASGGAKPPVLKTDV